MAEWDSVWEAPRVERVRICGIDMTAGDRVRLWPRKRADIMDIALEGMTATIEAIEQDLEGQTYLAVTLDDDPGKDLGALRQIGHRFFFHVNEVEPLTGSKETPR